jgi:hypothetical protein
MTEGDFVIVARGRRYFSNDALIASLAKVQADIQLKLGQVHSTDVYVLNERSIEIVRVSAQHMTHHRTEKSHTAN